MHKLFSLIFVTLFVSCSATVSDTLNVHQSWPSRGELFDNFRQSKKILIIFNHDHTNLGNILTDAVNAMKEISNEMEVIIKKDNEVSDEELKQYPVYILALDGNKVLEKISNNIPVIYENNGFEFDRKKYTGISDLIKISFYPNPVNPQMPLSFIIANNADTLEQFIKTEIGDSWGRFFWDNWGYQVIENNKRTVMGNFSEDSLTKWTIDKKLHWEFNHTGELVAETPFVKIYDHHAGRSMEEVQTYARQMEFVMHKISAFTGMEIQQANEVHFYPNVEPMALAYNKSEQTLYDDKIVCTVTGGEYDGISNGYEYIPVIRSLIGNTEIISLEKGIAVWATPNWQKHGYVYWGNKLNQAGIFPPLEELLDNELFNSNSDLIMNCMSAIFIEFLVETKGKDYLIKNYTKFENQSQELLILEKDWKNYLDIHFTNPMQPSEKRNVQFQFLKGVNFAHEGYDIYNGYMGSRSMSSLEHLQTTGANTISILPYSGFRSMEDPHPFRLSKNAGGENDAAVICAAYKAKQLGFTVMLKPQIWSWKGWTGDITMKNEAEWDLFFQYYDEWIMHYALLAEIYDIDILCVGNEFKNATLTHQEKWSELFKKVRKVYSGKITYAANWGDEFEKVSFWDELDFISLNCYYPLSQKSNPTDDELSEQMEKNLDLIESVSKKYNKPFLFTEIGFKSIQSPWINPHKDDDEQAYDETAQKRCYEIMFKAIADEKWINGIYLWKWPSYVEFSKEYQKDFNPYGKEAEVVMKEWFGRL